MPLNPELKAESKLGRAMLTQRGNAGSRESNGTPSVFRLWLPDLPGSALAAAKCAPDSERSSLEVDVIPGQPEQLIAAHTGQQSEAPQNREVSRVTSRKEGCGLRSVRGAGQVGSTGDSVVRFVMGLVVSVRPGAILLQRGRVYGWTKMSSHEAARAPDLSGGGAGCGTLPPLA
jgi:hypothetical protein